MKRAAQITFAARHRRLCLARWRLRRPMYTPPSPADPTDHPALSDSLRLLARRGEIRRYRKNTVLIEEDDVGDTLYIILSGRLRSYSSGANGREITYGVYGPGEYLGEMSLDGGRRSASVESLQASVCSVLGRATLERHIAEHPAFAFELMAKIIRRARAATLSAKQLALNDVYGRLQLQLNSLAVAQPDGTHRIGERLTHKDMAHRLGCSREMVSRLMKDLSSGAYIAQDGPHTVLLRPLPARW